MRRTQIGGPIGEKFGRDPGTFAVNFVRANRGRVAKLINRMAQRTGHVSWTAGGETRPLVVTDGDSDEQVAHVLTLWALREPDALRDEQRRIDYLLPVGVDGQTSGEAAPAGNAFVDALNAITGAAGAILPIVSEVATAASGGSKPKEPTPAPKEDNTMLYLALGAIGLIVFLGMKR